MKNKPIITQSGEFIIRDHILIDFIPDSKNQVSPEGAALVLRHLIFPESDIEVIADGLFHDMTVADQIHFPSSLSAIGEEESSHLLSGTIVHCQLPHVNLPESVTLIGELGFSQCHIHSLTLHHTLFGNYYRQFKDTQIGRLYLNTDAEQVRQSQVIRSLYCNAHVERIELDGMTYKEWEQILKD